jgi:hypothetical protein
MTLHLGRALACGVLAVSVAFLGSCSVTQTLSIEKDGSGTSNSEIALKPYLGKYLEKNKANFSAKKTASKGLFDVDGIKKSFAKNPDVALKSVSSKDAYSLSMSLGFKDLEKGLGKGEDLKKTGAYSLTKSGGKSTLKLLINRDTLFKFLAAFIPDMDQSYLETFMALPIEENDGVPQKASEYIDYIAGFIDPGKTPKTTLRDDIQKDKVSVVLQPKGKLLSATLKIGSKSSSAVKGAGAQFDIPVLSLLMLYDPIEMTVEWQE